MTNWPPFILTLSLRCGIVIAPGTFDNVPAYNNAINRVLFTFIYWDDAYANCSRK
jgi:hypothetical protein